MKPPVPPALPPRAEPARAERPRATPAAASAAPATPLGGLLAHIAQARAQAGLPGTQETLAQFRQLWGQLSTERQIRQSVASVPEGAGPLNSQRLVLRALQTMQGLSPEYLNRYMAYLDTLLWLDEAGAALMPPPPRPAAQPVPRAAPKPAPQAAQGPAQKPAPKPAPKPARKAARAAGRKPARPGGS